MRTSHTLHARAGCLTRSFVSDPGHELHSRQTLTDCATLLGLFLKNVHRDKHGSDTGTYDHEGRFLPQKFEDIFAKYAEGRDYLTIWDVKNVLRGQRCIADPIGWGGAFFECKLFCQCAL